MRGDKHQERWADRFGSNGQLTLPVPEWDLDAGWE
jgi:hypothetical protein